LIASTVNTYPFFLFEFSLRRLLDPLSPSPSKKAANWLKSEVGLSTCALKSFFSSLQEMAAFRYREPHRTPGFSRTRPGFHEQRGSLTTHCLNYVYPRSDESPLSQRQIRSLPILHLGSFPSEIRLFSSGLPTSFFDSVFL